MNWILVLSSGRVQSVEEMEYAYKDDANSRPKDSKSHKSMKVILWTGLYLYSKIYMLKP